MEQMQRYISVGDLYKAYAEHNLTETLKTLTDDELDYLIMAMFRDDIIGIRIDILGALNNEKEYRISDAALAKRKK